MLLDDSAKLQIGNQIGKYTNTRHNLASQLINYSSNSKEVQLGVCLKFTQSVSRFLFLDSSVNVLFSVFTSVLMSVQTAEFGSIACLPGSGLMPVLAPLLPVER